MGISLNSNIPTATTYVSNASGASGANTSSGASASGTITATSSVTTTGTIAYTAQAPVTSDGNTTNTNIVATANVATTTTLAKIGAPLTPTYSAQELSSIISSLESRLNQYKNLEAQLTKLEQNYKNADDAYTLAYYAAVSQGAISTNGAFQGGVKNQTTFKNLEMLQEAMFDAKSALEEFRQMHGSFGFSEEIKTLENEIAYLQANSKHSPDWDMISSSVLGGGITNTSTTSTSMPTNTNIPSIY